MTTSSRCLLYASDDVLYFPLLRIIQQVRTVDITPTIIPIINTPIVRPAAAPDDKLLLLSSLSSLLHVLVERGLKTDVVIRDVTETAAMLGDCILTFRGLLGVVALGASVVALGASVVALGASVVALGALVVAAAVGIIVLETPAVAKDVIETVTVVMETVTGVVIEKVAMVGRTLLGQVVFGRTLNNGKIISSPSVTLT